MKIVDNRKSEFIAFYMMPAGSTFLDMLGDLCIKVGSAMWFNCKSNTLMDVVDKSASYEVVNTKLVITNYRGETNDSGESNNLEK